MEQKQKNVQPMSNSSRENKKKYLHSNVCGSTVPVLGSFMVHPPNRALLKYSENKIIH